MPIVKKYERQIDTNKAPTPSRLHLEIPQLQTPPPQPAKPAEAYGAGFGQDLARIGFELYALEQDRQDQIRVSRAEQKISDWMVPNVYGDGGAFRTQGEAALGMPDKLMEGYDKLVGDVGSELNDRQRLRFSPIAERRREQLLLQANEHAMREARVLDDATTKANVSTAMSLGVANYAEPKQAADAIDDLRRYWTQYGERNGWNGAEIKKAIDDSVGALHVEGIKHLLDLGLDGRARQALAANRNQIAQQHGEKLGALEKAVVEKNVLGDAQRYADDIVTGKLLGQLEQGNIVVQPPAAGMLKPGQKIVVGAPQVAEVDGKYVLLPGVDDDGKPLPNDQAIARYRAGGKHFGVFATAETAQRGASAVQARTNRLLNGDDPAPTLSELLDEAAQIEKPEVRERAQAEIRAWDSARQQDKRNAAELATRQAKAYIDQVMLNSKNVIDRTRSFDSIPQSIRDQLSLPEEKALREYADSLVKEKPIKTDLPTYYRLLALSSAEATRDAFAQMNLLEYVNVLDEGDFKKLSDIQAAIRKGDGKKADDLTGGFRTVDAMIDDALKLVPLNPNPPKDDVEGNLRIAKLRRAVDQEIADFEGATGKKPDKQEIQRMIDRHLTKGTITEPHWYGNREVEKLEIDVPAGEAFKVQINQVPPAERVKIEAALRRNRMAVNDANIVMMYLAKTRGTKAPKPPQWREDLLGPKPMSPLRPE